MGAGLQGAQGLPCRLDAGQLTANAALYGRVQGRGFRLTLILDSTTGTLRIAVTDTHGEKLPVLRSAPQPDSESGRGLLLVVALADRWGTEPYPPAGKTVWALIHVPGAPGGRQTPGPCADRISEV